jgi:hypothetical protein
MYSVYLSALTIFICVHAWGKLIEPLQSDAFHSGYQERFLNDSLQIQLCVCSFSVPWPTQSFSRAVICCQPSPAQSQSGVFSAAQSLIIETSLYPIATL